MKFPSRFIPISTLRSLTLAGALIFGVGRLALPVDGAEKSGRHFDIIIRGGTVIDGTGGARRPADVGIIGDTVWAVGDLSECSAGKEISASNRLVTPGFIDMHAHVADGTHGENGLLSADRKRRAAQNFLLQGITSGAGNPDGDQVEPLLDQRRKLTALGIGMNVALFDGHEFLRQNAMGKNRERPANAEELAKMKTALAHSLAEEGSFGLTTGLEYYSMLYSDTAELVALARTLAEYGGIYSAHQRSQGIAPMWYKPSVNRDIAPPTLEQALRESIAVADTGATVMVTHIKAWGPGYRGQAPKYIAMLQGARDRGDRIFCDLYTYESAGSDGGFVMLPPWALGATGTQQVNTDAAEAATEKKDYTALLQKALRDPAKKEDIAKDVQNQVDLKGGAEHVMVLNFKNPDYNNKSIADLMKERKQSLVDVAIGLQLEGDPHLPGGVKLRAVSMDAADVEAFFRQPWTATDTDGWIVLPEEAVGPRKYFSTNQRCFGTYTRRLAVISMEDHVDSLEEAVRKSSQLPAQLLNLNDRGQLTPGMKADVLVIDLANLKDYTTIAEPSVYPTGMDYVFVNGVMVVEKGKTNLALPGKVLDPAGRPAKL